jgi:YjeF-related protein N-terminus
MPPRFGTDTGKEVPAVTAAQMREVDRIAIEETGPNLFQMMENAGSNLAAQALEALGVRWREALVVVLAGPGGNGGGGICAARHLANPAYASCWSSRSRSGSDRCRRCSATEDLITGTRPVLPLPDPKLPPLLRGGLATALAIAMPLTPRFLFMARPRDHRIRVARAGSALVRMVNRAIEQQSEQTFSRAPRGRPHGSLGTHRRNGVARA